MREEFKQLEGFDFSLICSVFLEEDIVVLIFDFNLVFLDGIRAEVVPQIAACRCHFFDDCGKLSPRSGQIGREGLWIDEVLRRRFLRLSIMFLFYIF